MKRGWARVIMAGASALAAACGSETRELVDGGLATAMDGAVSPSGDGGGGSVTPVNPGDAAAGPDGASSGEGGTPNPSDGGAGGDGASPELAKFSFFVTSWAGMQRLSKSANGFGGDLRYGETGDGAGLRGADKICTELAESSMAGAGGKQWRAFLSTSTVNAKDRVGPGPWYDRRGRLLALTLTDLLNQRPVGADPAIVDDFPNETGTPNHDPDGTGAVDNHDILTGTNAEGTVYCPGSSDCHCSDWTSAAPSGRPRVGHSWPRTGGPGGFFGGGGSGGGGFGGMDMAHWISSLDEAGCAPGASLVEMGPPQASNPTVGSGGGYGGIYCFALSP